MRKKQLLELIDSGHNPTFHFFWRGPLSQWAASPFTHNGIKYLTAEHWMMAEKARLFKDEETLRKILKASSPKEAKALGREVKNYNDEKWGNARFERVVAGNYLKFDQNPTHREALIATGDSILVEASPKDTIWGIGLAEDHPNASNPKRWPGQNLLGFALMEVRKHW